MGTFLQIPARNALRGRRVSLPLGVTVRESERSRSLASGFKMKEKITFLYREANIKFSEQFGFGIHDVTLKKIVDYMYTPKDSSSLAVTRIFFGLAMLFDIPDERGGANLDKRWGDPRTCHFPLLPFVQAMSMPYMAVVYAALWFGALGIMLGYKYRISATMFTVCYWYLFLIEKSYWNNHSYLFGLVGLLLTFTQANCYWSLDGYLNPTLLKHTVPYWNYFILKYQFFILYFMAGMKKGTAEWLTGYSVQNLSEHWVFEPFKIFLTVPQIDYIIVHWFIFIFDLTVSIWMMWSYTRNVAMILCALFHLMNSRLFRIGMFPWVCLATMPLFYPFEWPKTVMRYLTLYYMKVKSEMCNRAIDFRSKRSRQCQFNESENVDDCDGKDEVKHHQEFDDHVYEDNDKIINRVGENNECPLDKVDNELPTENDASASKPSEKDVETDCTNVEMDKKITVYLILFYVLSQLFLPYSHFITKGYNNWTNGLYGYSWDMMVHSWDVQTVIIKIVDNDKNIESYIDPYLFTPNDRWSRHGDMIYQYAQCLKDNIIKDGNERKKWTDPNRLMSNNISIYIDVWCSMNGRFTQRLFDPKVDILTAQWSPFTSSSYLMPLLDEALGWRRILDDLREEVHSWSNASSVLFLADLPGYDQEKYIPIELKNVTLKVLDGLVVFEPEVSKRLIGKSYQLTSGDQIRVGSGSFHKVLNIGENPAFYMYTFYNSSEIEDHSSNVMEYKHKLPIFQELNMRFSNMLIFCRLVLESVFQIIFPKSQCH